MKRSAGTHWPEGLRMETQVAVKYAGVLQPPEVLAVLEEEEHEMFVVPLSELWLEMVKGMVYI